MDEIKQIIKRNNIHCHQNQGILVVKAQNTHEGFRLVKEILYEISTKRRMLYLSGGRTPKELYRKLADEEKLEAGAVGLIDERFGKPFHENSNEKMLQDSGLLRYLQIKDVRFYPILGSHPGGSETTDSPRLRYGEAGRISSGDSIAEFTLRKVEGLQNDSLRKKAAEAYDKTIRELNNVYQKSIGILGVGMDGHTAGIAGNRHDFKNSMFGVNHKQLLVSEFDDQKGMFGERISMTFLGLSMLDLNLVLVFGDDKKEALEKMFADGSEEDIPSRFFKRPDIAVKTILITDQDV